MDSMFKLPGMRQQVPSGGHRDNDLLAVGALLWIASVVRVVLELINERQFGVEATLALACVVALPWLLRRS